METDDTKSSDMFEEPIPPNEILREVSDSEVIFATSLTTEQLEQAGFKTIVINGQAIDVVTKDTLNCPSTSFNKNTYTIVSPLTSVRKTKYNWDPSVHDAVLPVRCRNTGAELYKNRFGSGGRGRCIKANDTWYTPSEFEAICGRANSKDWKRSIRYAGRTLQCLIEEGLLEPHASSCPCASCTDDETVSGPVRLFTPYKRRKKELNSDTEDKGNSDAMVVSVSQDGSIPSGASLVDSLSINQASFMSEDSGSVIVAPATPAHSSRNTGANLDFQEQRHWWQLEEMVKNLSRQVQEIQKQVEAVKAQSLESRDVGLQQLRLQMENEKKEALNTSRIEAQMNLSRAILEARSEKDIAVQQALQQLCANCNREAFSDCTGCNRVSYCGAFCQRKDWANHRNDCGNGLVESDKSE